MRRFFAAAVAAFLLATPVAAQPKSQAYQVAAHQWSTLDKYERARLQVHLTAAGFWNAVPKQDFNQRLFDAITQFQVASGLAPTGYLSGSDWGVLINAAKPALAYWGLKEVKHPFRKATIWVPLGMGLKTVRDKEGAGLEFEDPQGRVWMAFYSFANSRVEIDHRNILSSLTQKGETVLFEVLRPDFFVVTVRSPNGLTRYLRYHQDGPFVTGFTLTWRNNDAPVFGERLSAAISGSLWAVSRGIDFIYPPNFENEKVAAAPVPTPAPAPVPTRPAVAAAPPPEPEKDEGKLSSGTGFFVTRDGYVVTNQHVIGKCSDAAVVSDAHEFTMLRVVATDETNDLALLKADVRNPVAASIKIGSRLGEGVAVFGYPLATMLASSGNFTLGSITALAGMRDDTRHLQIQAPVQPGNSGGPLLDNNGNVIGVVKAKLNAVNVASSTGDIPQNVNFAIKAGVLASFLDSKAVTYDMVPRTASMPSTDLADHAKALSVMVICK